MILVVAETSDIYNYKHKIYKRNKLTAVTVIRDIFNKCVAFR